MSHLNSSSQRLDGETVPSRLLEGEARGISYPRAPGGYYSYGGAPAPGWSEGTLAHYWSILTRRKFTLICITLAGAAAAFLLTRYQTPMYRARALVEIQNLNEDFLNTRAVNPTESSSQFQSPEYNLRTQTIILRSKPVVERAMATNGLEQRIVETLPRTESAKVVDGGEPSGASLHDRAIRAIGESLNVRPQPSTRVIEITFDSADPLLAADTANALIASFSEVSLERRWQASQDTARWLGRQVEDVKAKLQNAEAALQSYASRANLTILSEREDAAEEKLRQVQAELSKSQAERITKQSVYELVSEASPETLAQVQDDPSLKEYQVQLTALRRQLAALSSSFTPQYPKVIDIKAEIATVEAAFERKRAAIVSRIRNDYTAATRRERLLETDYSRQTAVVASQAGKLARYSVLKREAEANRQLYDSIIQRVREAGLASAMRASEIRVLEAATPPPRPYTPNVILNMAVGVLGSFCFGAVFLTMRYSRAQRGIVEPGQIAIELNLPELGVIPSSGFDSSRVQRLLGSNAHEQETRPELTTMHQWPSAMSESFRLTLASILLPGGEGGRPRVIVLTSANPGEGKTTVASNLAVALARVEKRVLLIDGDIRKPRLHDLFGLDNGAGLCEALSTSPAASIKETSIPNLFVLPSGRRTHADERIFFTSRLPQLLRRLKTEFDMILIDTPPMLQMSDARLMGNHADAVIVVVAQHTQRDAVLLVQQRLAEDGTRLLGMILNNWNPKDSLRSYRMDAYRKYYNG